MPTVKPTICGAETVLLSDHSWIDLWPKAVLDNDLVPALLANLPLRQEAYRIAGKVVCSPRLMSWHGDAGSTYTYSGVTHDPAPWTSELADLRATVESITDLKFDSVLVNLYRDGRDSVSWHADDEPEVGPAVDDRWVASLSLGSPRRFVLRGNRDGSRWERWLGHGDLLVMRGRTQSEYQHCVPKTRRVVGPRVNLTFRARVR